MYAPAKGEYPIISAEELPKFDAFVFGIPTRYGNFPAQWKVCLSLSFLSFSVYVSAFLRFCDSAILRFLFLFGLVFGVLVFYAADYGHRCLRLRACWIPQCGASTTRLVLCADNDMTRWLDRGFPLLECVVMGRFDSQSGRP